MTERSRWFILGLVELALSFSVLYACRYLKADTFPLYLCGSMVIVGIMFSFDAFSRVRRGRDDEAY